MIKNYRNRTQIAFSSISLSMTPNVAHLTKFFPRFSKIQGRLQNFAQKNWEITERCLNENFTYANFRPSFRQIAKIFRKTTWTQKIESHWNREGAGRMPFFAKKSEQMFSKVKDWTNLNIKSILYNCKRCWTKEVLMSMLLPEISNMILFFREKSFKMILSP